MKDLKLISDELNRFTIKKPNPIQRMSTTASTKNNAMPDINELVRGYFFLRFVPNSLVVIHSILYQNRLIVYIKED